MFYDEGLLGLITTFVSAFLPSISTFNAIKTNNAEALEFVSKYWVVFGIWTSLEVVANAVRLIGFLPGYQWLKLSAFIWIYFFGHDFFYYLLSPMVDESEPVGAKILEYISRGLPLLGEGVSFIATRILAAFIRWQEERDKNDVALLKQPSERSLSQIWRPKNSNRESQKSISLSPLTFPKSVLARPHRSDEDLKTRSFAARRARFNSLSLDQPCKSAPVTTAKYPVEPAETMRNRCNLQ